MQGFLLPTGSERKYFLTARDIWLQEGKRLSDCILRNGYKGNSNEGIMITTSEGGVIGRDCGQAG